MNGKKVLRGSIVFTQTPDKFYPIENGFIALNNGIVEASGDAGRMPEGYFSSYETLDYGKSIIIPAFVDMHLHAPQYPMLGLGMDLPLLEWLNTYTFKTEAQFENEDFARRSYSKLAKELIKKGTTRVVMFSSIHKSATLILMEELEKAGISGYVGKVNMDRGSPDYYVESTDGSLEATRSYIEQARSRFKSVKPIITPRFTPSCTDKLMRGLGELAEEYDLPVQSHLSENTDEIKLVRSLCPACDKYWQTYKESGLWTDKTVMAHCVHVDSGERAEIKRAGVTVAHCPDSNTNIYSGVAPVRKMLLEGVNVALGTDVAGGASISIMHAITSAVRASKLRYYYSGQDASERFLSVSEAFYLATTAGQSYFGCKAGFENGKPLHALVLDDGRLAEPVRRLSLEERLERLIYADDDRNIVARFSNGRKI